MKLMKQENICKFCGSAFAKSSTLSTHMCVKKQRFLDLNSTGSRFGFRTFQRFYELTVRTKKPKTTEEFIDSQYYIEFVKFGNHLALLKPVYIEKYIDYVILNGVKLKDWTKDFVYDLYIEDLIKKEPAISATERTIEEIMAWCEKNNVQFNEFFIKITANEICHLIKYGKLSPWVLYLASTGGIVMDNFNEDHAKIVGSIIDPGFWMRKFKNSDDDVDYIKSLLEQAGL